MANIVRVGGSIPLYKELATCFSEHDRGIQHEVVNLLTGEWKTTASASGVSGDYVKIWTATNGRYSCQILQDCTVTYYKYGKSPQTATCTAGTYISNDNEGRQIVLLVHND